MSSDGRDDVASDGERRLTRQLDIASEVARAGAQSIGRELCATIFLEHSTLLLSDRASKQRFVECLLMLRMNNLLTRLLGATDGVELKISTLVVQGTERMVLAFGSDASLSVPVSQMGVDGPTRAQFATFWAERILHAVNKLANSRTETPHTQEALVA